MIGVKLWTGLAAPVAAASMGNHALRIEIDDITRALVPALGDFSHCRDSRQRHRQ